jgi:protein-S-isoprenylcysteine O-methyltransferase Ste14
MNYLGGGLLAANWVLTIIPTLSFALMIALRIGEEEQMLVELFGNTYIAYMERTGRFLPFF